MEVKSFQKEVPVKAVQYVTAYSLELTEQELIYLLYFCNRNYTVPNAISYNGTHINKELKKFLTRTWQTIRSGVPDVFEKFKADRDKLTEYFKPALAEDKSCWCGLTHHPSTHPTTYEGRPKC